MLLLLFGDGAAMEVGAAGYPSEVHTRIEAKSAHEVKPVDSMVSMTETRKNRSALMTVKFEGEGPLGTCSVVVCAEAWSGARESPFALAASRGSVIRRREAEAPRGLRVARRWCRDLAAHWYVGARARPGEVAWRARREADLASHLVEHLHLGAPTEASGAR